MPAANAPVGQPYRITDMVRAIFRWAFFHLWRSRHNCTNRGHIIMPQGRCAACGIIPAVVLEADSAETIRAHSLK